MVFKCPRCGRTRFHIEKAGNRITIKCEATKDCGWQIEAIEKSSEDTKDKDEEKDIKVRNILLEYRKKSIEDFEWPWLEEHPLSMKNANKFFLASMIDFQMSADKVWDNAKKLSEELFGDPEELWNYITENFPTENQWQEFIIEQKESGFSIHRFDWVANKIWNAAEIIVEKYDGDARNIWKDFKSNEELVEKIKMVIGANSEATAKMIVLALNEEKHINIGKSDVKPDVHVMKVVGRVYYGREVDAKKAIEITRRILPENPGILDNPLYSIGKSVCNISNPQCNLCPLNDVCEYVKIH